MKKRRKTGRMGEVEDVATDEVKKKAGKRVG